MAALALVLGLSGAASAEIYSWRTEDGAYAFADDPSAIPARYKDQVRVRGSSKLGSYKRFTPKDDVASKTYEKRLAQRLERLRAFNSPPEPSQPAAPGGSGPARETVTLRSGNGGSSVEIATEPGDEPLVIETVFVRRDGKAVVQPMRVTRRGDHVIAVEKPRTRQWNLLSDVYDEDDLGEIGLD
jgi:hypothetical protein